MVKKYFVRLLILVEIIALIGCGNATNPPTNTAPRNTIAPISAQGIPTSVAPQISYVPVNQYDPKRDATKDIQAAINEAQRTRKRILLEVGGDWCVWCHIMDEYFNNHPDLLVFREQKFITVKINFSPENDNEAVLSRYPDIPGYPHIFVLDTDGKLLHSQNTAALEQGRSYNDEKFWAFLRKWAINP